MDRIRRGLIAAVTATLVATGLLVGPSMLPGGNAIPSASAACPQVAGVCALIKEACMKLTPPQVRDILMSTARDVTTGTCNPNTGGNAATVGPDLATGNGLVDAHKAVLLATMAGLALKRSQRMAA